MIFIVKQLAPKLVYMRELRLKGIATHCSCDSKHEELKDNGMQLINYYGHADYMFVCHCQ